MATNQMTGRGNLRAAWAPKIAGGVRRLSAALFLGLVLSGCVGATLVEDGETEGPYRKKWVLHTDQVVTSLAFSPDGRVLATAGHGRSNVQLWNLKEGRLIREMKTPYRASELFSFTPDGSSLLTFPVGGKPRAPAVAYGFSLVDIATDRVRDIESPYGTMAEAVALSPKGDVAIALYAPWEKGRIAVYDTNSWEIIRQFAPERRIASTIAISPDGIHLAVAKYQGGVQIWDYRKGELVREFRVHTDNLASLAFNPNGQLLATGGTFGTAIFDPNTKQKIDLIDDDLVRIWRVEDGKKHTSFIFISPPYKSSVRSVNFSPFGTLLAAGTGGVITMFPVDETNDKQPISFGPSDGFDYWAGPTGFGADGRYFAAAGVSRGTRDNRIIVWERFKELKY
ncbi:MAG: WD40 repeat domain-containing protein [Rhodospirillales bacterium]|nr:WD40 repeat domain-containing protein [Rhodospirillales bacterium]